MDANDAPGAGWAGGIWALGSEARALPRTPTTALQGRRRTAQRVWELSQFLSLHGAGSTEWRAWAQGQSISAILF